MAELELRFGNKLHSTLHRGDGGVFEVLVDGELVFSKRATGVFPKKGQIAAIVGKKLDAKKLDR